MTSVEFFSKWAKHLEEREARKSRVTLPVARQILARRLKVLPGTLESLTKRRLKDISVGLAAKLREAIEHDLRQQIERLESELEVARRGGSHLDGTALSAVERALDEARRHLGSG